jgi:hypothetical protein
MKWPKSLERCSEYVLLNPLYLLLFLCDHDVKFLLEKMIVISFSNVGYRCTFCGLICFLVFACRKPSKKCAKESKYRRTTTKGRTCLYSNEWRSLKHLINLHTWTHVRLQVRLCGTGTGGGASCFIAFWRCLLFISYTPFRIHQN